MLYTSERAAEECAELVDAEIISAVREDIEYLRGLIAGTGDAIAIREMAYFSLWGYAAYSVYRSLYPALRESFVSLAEV